MNNNVTRLKCGRVIGSKDTTPQKKREEQSGIYYLDSKQASPKEKTIPKEVKPMKRLSIPRILKFSSIAIMIFRIEMR